MDSDDGNVSTWNNKHICDMDDGHITNTILYIRNRLNNRDVPNNRRASLRESLANLVSEANVRGIR